MNITDAGVNGSGAVASLTVVDGTITAVTLLGGGSGYLSPPLITITDDTGSGAVITASLATGVFPTDKLFTGQRLDATGLYYYNARYYDANIGRFISADIIVQSPANPQTLNRYTYCLNNPLKYIDPSGHVAEIDGVDTQLAWEIYTNHRYLWDLNILYISESTQALLLAWFYLKINASALVDSIEQDVRTVAIQFGNSTSFERAVNNFGTNILTISHGFNNLANSTEIIACALAHESFHAGLYLAGGTGRVNTVANEAFAYSLSYQISKALDVSNQWSGVVPLALRLSHIDPYTEINILQEQLIYAREILYIYPNSVYKHYCFRGKEHALPIWPGIFNFGKNRLLTYARSVWVYYD